MNNQLNSTIEQDLRKQLELAQTQISDLQKENEALRLECRNTRMELMQADSARQRLQAERDYLDANYQMVINSRGHQILEKYYALRSNGLAATLKSLFKKNAPVQHADPYESYQAIRFCQRIDILTPPHTKYIAELLQGLLHRAGLECNVIQGTLEKYEDIPYIMICPMNYKHFPKVYVAFQMEQTVSSRWLTEEYMKALYNAYAVFDYSLVNLAYFSQDPKLAKKLYYMPVDLCRELAEQNNTPVEQEYDILFYGVTAGDHRQAFLKPIAEKYNIRIVEELFGDALYAELKKAKLIINIHYYENALLETTRLYEVLSRTDALIISERSTDPGEEQKLEGIVDFVEIGDVDAMMQRIEYWLSHEAERCEKVRSNKQLLCTRPNAAEFYFNRFLLANDRIGFDYFYETVGTFVQFEGDRLCLSLPETTKRRADFDADNQYGFEVFPGLKHHLGWIGCGLSYKFIFKKVQEKGLDRVLVCEDDVYFPVDFPQRFSKLLQYIDANPDWDIYNGIVSDIKAIEVLGCNEADGETYVSTDRIIGMVFNIYKKAIYQTIIDWDHTNQTVETNTIDRYLQSRPRKVLTNVPFIVGHKEDLDSTLWNGSNAIYTEQIAASSKALRDAAEAYKNRSL